MDNPAFRPLARRQIHLDFHTSPLIPDVGADFDAEEFAEILVEAGVQSVTLFAKCHHGHLYYDTPSPARHPTLSRPLLEEQIQALRSRQIRCPIYLSVQCDEYAANNNPDWRVINPDGTLFGRKPLKDEFYSWQFLDLSSPYVDYLEDQLIEILQKFCPVDGLFFDMCWDQPSVSKWAMSGMRAQGLDPASEEDRGRYAKNVTHGYMRRFTEIIRQHQSDVPVWFNGRRMIQVGSEKEFLTHIEVEALPTGQWGYSFFPTHIRLVKPFEMPMIGMTGSFHKSWADFGGLRTVPSLYYDCAQAVAHGAACSVGDQLHPSGRLNRGTYSIVGSSFRQLSALDPWLDGATSPREIAVLYQDPFERPLAAEVQDGATKALTQLAYQFVFIPPQVRWEDYPIIIIPETIEMTPDLEARIEAYLAAGGGIVHEDMRGDRSPFSSTYLRFADETLGSLPSIDHVFYEPGVRLTVPSGASALARIVEPYFERTWDAYCSHAQTPPRLEASPYAAGFVNGRRAIFALPVFRAYARHANLACRQLLSAALKALLPQPQIRLAGPSHLEAIVADQPGRRIIHLFSFIPQKRTATLEMIEDSVCARNVGVDLLVERKVSSVTIQPGGQSLNFEATMGRVRFIIPWVEGHQVVVVA